MTAQALADRCGELGLPMDRSVIAKLEKGLRQSITIPELIVLAKALDVAPVRLLFPLEEQGKVEILPGREVPTWRAAEWFDGSDDDALEAKGWDPHTWRSPDPIVMAFRWHRRHLESWSAMQKLLAGQRKEAKEATDPDMKRGLTEVVTENEKLLKKTAQDLAWVRQNMRQLGVAQLPEIPSELRSIDVLPLDPEP
ncbi:helix-turn-helix domain-containing protein [Nonomuraea antri]|uniref:helix-turn-helix domain-containing protein n=1 Tax=Nonomuraea antri TaxID=2730852 RepID=UPI0022A843C8|nr:helix-turn-helix transcriptional regulator [Nonomuraea antri]